MEIVVLIKSGDQYRSSFLSIELEEALYPNLVISFITKSVCESPTVSNSTSPLS